MTTSKKYLQCHAGAQFGEPFFKMSLFPWTVSIDSLEFKEIHWLIKRAEWIVWTSMFDLARCRPGRKLFTG